MYWTINSSLVTFFVSLSLFCAPVQAQYNANIELEVSQAFGHQFSLPPGSGRYLVGSSMAEDRIALANSPDFTSQLRQMPLEELRAMLPHYLQKKAHDLGIPEEGLSNVVLVADKIPMIRVPEQYGQKLITAALADGIVLRQHNEGWLSQEARQIGPDLLPSIVVIEETAQALLDLIKRTVLPTQGAEVLEPDYLSRLELNSILEKAKAVIQSNPGSAKAPDRVRLERQKDRINLAQMTAAEQNAWESATTIFYDVEKIATKLIGLQSNPLQNLIKKSAAYNSLLRSVVGDAVPDLNKEYLEIVAKVTSAAVGNFAFDVRHYARQYHRIHYSGFLPLYSFGLIHSLRLSREVDGFNEALFGSYHFEIALFRIMNFYQREVQSLDNITTLALAQIARLQFAHPLVRLSAHQILALHLDHNAANELTQLTDESLRKLIALSSERVVMAPTHTSSVLRPQLDILSDVQTDVSSLWSAVKPLRNRLGLVEIELPTRFLPRDKHREKNEKRENSLGERALEAIREARESGQPLVLKKQDEPESKPIVAGMGFPKKYPIVAKLSSQYYLVQKEPFSLAIVAKHLDEQVVQILPLEHPVFKIEKEPRAAGYSISYPELGRRYLYGLRFNRYPMAHLLSYSQLSKLECESLLKKL
jgi:hypothetical protein